MTAAPPVPMARLLAMGLRLLVDGLHERLSARGWDDVRPSYGFVLLAVRDASTTTGRLAELLGVTKQATSKLLDAMEASGYVRRLPDARDARSKIVELDTRGHELLADVERIYADLDAEWAAAIGLTALEQTRSRLTRVVLSAHDGVFPAVRPAA